MSEKVSAASGQFPEGGHPSLMLSLGQLAPPGVMVRCAVELGNEDPVRIGPVVVSHLLSGCRLWVRQA
jgi:hypothetical protein